MSPATSTQRAYYLAAVALMVVVFGLGMVVAGDRIVGIDPRFGRWVQSWQGGFPKTLQQIGDFVGGTWGSVIAGVIALGAAYLSKNRHLLGWIGVIILLRIAALGLKPIFASPRPSADHLELLRQYDSTGYPSGHSMSAATLAATITVYAWYNCSRASAISTTVVMIALTVFVGWSRIWSGAHWPTDVLGGWMTGVAIVLFATGINIPNRHSAE